MYIRNQTDDEYRSPLSFLFVETFYKNYNKIKENADLIGFLRKFSHLLEPIDPNGCDSLTNGNMNACANDTTNAIQIDQESKYSVINSVRYTVNTPHLTLTVFVNLYA